MSNGCDWRQALSLCLCLSLSLSLSLRFSTIAVAVAVAGSKYVHAEKRRTHFLFARLWWSVVGLVSLLLLFFSPWLCRRSIQPSNFNPFLHPCPIPVYFLLSRSFSSSLDSIAPHPLCDWLHSIFIAIFLNFEFRVGLLILSYGNFRSIKI